MALSGRVSSAFSSSSASRQQQQKQQRQAAGPSSLALRKAIVSKAAASEANGRPLLQQELGTTKPASETSRRTALLNVAALFAGATATVGAAAAVAPPAARADASPYLLSTGAKGPLAEEEARLLALRRQLEGEVRRELQAEREALEREARDSAVGKLCATPFGIDIVGITEFVALVGALVGGITARQRKAELERLNEQLRRVNMSLRQQARAGMVYAPGLTYAPSAGAPAPADAAAAASAAAAVIVAPPPPVTTAAPLSNGNGVSAAPPGAAAAAAGAAAAVAAAVVAPPNPAAATPIGERTLLSMDDDEMSADQVACRDALRSGKRLLKEKNGAAAMVRFEKALMLSKALQDRVQERRAMRGLAAAARLQGQHRAAIRHLERVLEISQAMGEYTGDADAYGTIADCYTELGDFEAAAANYDRYINVMNRDGPV